MKVLDVNENKVSVELTAEEGLGVFFSLLYVIDQVPDHAFASLLHFSKPVAFRLMKQFQNQARPELNSSLYDQVQSIYEEYGDELLKWLDQPEKYSFPRKSSS